MLCGDSSSSIRQIIYLRHSQTHARYLVKGGVAISYSIINADLGKDRESIIDLWRRNFESVPDGRYEWIYNNNPYGQPVCFLLKHDETDEIVGSYALFPRQLLLNGTSCRGYICGDLIVDTRHRSLGPAVSLVKAAIAKCNADGDSILFGFPNEFSAPVILMSGFNQLSDRIKLTKVIRTYPYLEKKCKSAWLARIVSWPLDTWLSIRYGRGVSVRGCKYEVVSSFDARFDLLFEQQTRGYLLRGEPSRSYLNWRFVESPYAKNEIFTMERRADGTLCGYIVFCCVDKRVQIVDLGFSDADQTLPCMIAAFHRYQKSRGNISIAFDFAGDDRLLQRLVAAGFSIRSRELKTIIYTPPAHAGWVEEIQQGSWYLTAADNDI